MEGLSARLPPLGSPRNTFRNSNENKNIGLSQQEIKTQDQITMNANNQKLKNGSETNPRASAAQKYSKTASNNKKNDKEKREGKEGEQKELRPNRRVQLPSNMEPVFYIGGGNGNALIEDVLTNMGWKRTKDKLDDNYKLRWCELKTAINYNIFKEGDQIVNHIPNSNLLTNKLGLLNSLQEYDRVCNAVKKRVPKLDFVPETFRLDDPKDREAFVETYQESEIWICKPTGRNQGKGIFLVRNMEEIKQALQETEEPADPGKPKKPLNRIIQRYLHKPLLLDKRKFDIRAYMLVGSTVPHLVLYHKGYVRLTIHEYNTDTDNLIAHLTNQFIQKKDPTYKEVKEDTAWSMDKFNEYMNENVCEEKGLEQDWVYSTLTSRMKQIMSYCFTAVKHKLQCKIGYFDLYGFDFMVDEDMKVWLIEVNTNPCLATNCEALREIVPGVVKETLYIAIECFEKSRRGRPIMPLQHQQGFQIIHNGCPKGVTSSRNRNASPTRQQSTTGSNSVSQQRSRSMSPVRRTRSLSPLKEAGVDSTKFASRGVTGPQKTVPKATPLPSSSAVNTRSGNTTLSGKVTSGQSAGTGQKERALRPNAEGQKPVSQSLQNPPLKMASSEIGSQSKISPYENSSSVTLKMTHAAQKKATKGKPPATQTNSSASGSTGKEKQNRGS